MAYRCLKVKMSVGGYHHSHILEITASDDATGGNIVGSRQQWVNSVKAGVVAYVQDASGKRAYLRVNHIGTTEYVQTVADGVWTDNLLALPRY